MPAGRLHKFFVGNGIRDDMLSLIYLMNTKVQVTIRTPIGESQPFICSNIVKQGTVLGPVLNNCSTDDFSKSNCPYYLATQRSNLWNLLMTSLI